MRLKGFGLAFLLLCACAAAPGANAQDEAPQIPAEPSPLPGLDLERLTATRTLPLFTPSRSAPVAEEEVAPEIVAEEPEIVAEPEAAFPSLRLIGIAKSQSDEFALLADQNTGEIQRLRSGEDFNGWTMQILDEHTVEFHSEGRQEKLTMFEEFGDMPAPAESYGEQIPMDEPLVLEEPEL